MAKDIKDYLHLYLGRQCIHDAGKIGTLAMIRKEYCGIDVGSPTGSLLKSEFRLKLILRPLSDMTEDEAWEMIGGKGLYKTTSLKLSSNGIDVWYEIDAGDEGTYSQGYECHWNALPPDKFKFLLSKGFDLFNLIDEGLATAQHKKR